MADPMHDYEDLFGPARGEPCPWPFECGEGWRPIIIDLLADLRRIAEEEGRPIRILQVKEKMGLLRVYTDSLSPRVPDRIDQAEEESGRVCEGCGAPSRRINLAGWLTTRCEACRATRFG